MKSTHALTKAIINNSQNPERLTRHYGVVVSIQGTTSPPTLTCTIDSNATQIPGIQWLDSYVPIVGDVVWLLRRKSTFLAVGALANSTTSWITATLNSPWGVFGGRPPQYRVTNNVVYFRGAASTTATTSSTVFTIPAAYQPTQNMNFAGFQAGPFLFNLGVTSSGSVTNGTLSTSGPANPIYFDNVTFTID